MPRRTASSGRTNIKDSEKKRALDYAKKTKDGRRIMYAENRLTLVAMGELPRFNNAVLNAEYDLRNISNKSALKKIIESSDNPNLNESLKQLFKNTQSEAFTKVIYDKEKLKFIFAYERKRINEEEAILFSNTFGQIICATFTAIGIDMSLFPISTEQIPYEIQKETKVEVRKS